MSAITVNGMTIAYEQHGSGPDLVLVTGIGYGGWFWHKVVPGLAAHFRVTTFDNRGAGGSDKPPGPYTIDMLAADTAALLDALRIRNAAVLGHSLGGFVAQRLVVTRPELVGKLILAATNYGGRNIVPTTLEAMAVLTNRQGEPVDLFRRGIEVATAPGFAQKNPQLYQELVAYRLENPVPPAQFAAQVAAGLGTLQWRDRQIDSHMAAIRVPTLILFGEDDRVVPPANAKLLAAKIKQARIKILPGSGHIFPLEDPAGTVAAIIEFMQNDSTTNS